MLSQQNLFELLFRSSPALIFVEICSHNFMILKLNRSSDCGHTATKSGANKQKVFAAQNFPYKQEVADEHTVFNYLGFSITMHHVYMTVVLTDTHNIGQFDEVPRDANFCLEDLLLTVCSYDCICKYSLNKLGLAFSYSRESYIKNPL